jgi:hypothetical protein
MKKTSIALHVGGRGNGLTTLMIDHAIQQARAGEVVEFWSTTFPNSDHAFRLCLKRLQTTHQADMVKRVYSRERRVEFNINSGRIAFRFAKDGAMLGNSTTTHIQDMENFGQVERIVK